ncbi:putative mRNA turnover protein 4 [Coleophoma cylindrospora]|uniref:Ribosome assembly factor mrt4 n=1 Tax=Coleophoma cylindrospora TaxID=1849047 RepID=A0A3D8SS52_9HELO|nr:putative mRNA turnover protein 4 [Coleophoma cylindrospora]
MPKSKRARVVHLTQVDKKGKELTLKLFANVRECLDQYQYCFVFSVENMRNTYLKDVRSEFSDSRIFFGKTKVMAKALGTTVEDEYQPNTAQLSKYLLGNVGLLFTSREPASIQEYFSGLAKTDFARAGTQATRAFKIPAGIVYSMGGEIAAEQDVPMAHSLEPELRKLNVPTTLTKGKITLENEYTVCKEGDTLDSRQTRLLKLFGVATADFTVQLVAYWSAATNEITEIETPEED